MVERLSDFLVYKLKSIECITLEICVDNSRRNDFMNFCYEKLIKYKNARLTKHDKRIAIAIISKVFAA